MFEKNTPIAKAARELHQIEKSLTVFGEETTRNLLQNSINIINHFDPSKLKDEKYRAEVIAAISILNPDTPLHLQAIETLHHTQTYQAYRDAMKDKIVIDTLELIQRQVLEAGATTLTSKGLFKPLTVALAQLSQSKHSKFDQIMQNFGLKGKLHTGR
jgi:hypothetical protein